MKTRWGVYNRVKHNITLNSHLIEYEMDKIDYVIIHELSHYMVAKIFRVKVKEIQFLPIGFYLKIDDLELEKLYKQILVLSAGPLSYFISYLVLKIMYKYDIISIYGYEDGKISNLFILLIFLLISLF